ARLHYANAGHPSSYFALPSTAWRELESVGPVLGLIAGATFPGLILEAGPGSRLFVCTDGVTEMRDPEGRMWGTGELVAILESSRSDDPCRVVERIVERLVQRRGARAQEDDLTVMLAERPPS